MKEINKYIDHTALKANTTAEEIIKLCDEAIKYEFKAVCINPTYVEMAKNYLITKNSLVKVCTVIGFPLGANKKETKIKETKLALKSGADEIDMVINISKFKNKDYGYVLEEIKSIRKICKNKVLKVIIETAYLSENEIEEITNIVIISKADYIKTSTGFASRGASIDDIKTIKKVIGENKLKIKASGGIKDKESAIEFINLGVDRIGTSSGISIVS